jgi:hypothetical protein
LNNFVLAPTNASRIPYIVLRCRASRLGACIDGRSIRHDTSLSTRDRQSSAGVPDAERPRQGRGHNAHFVPGQQRRIRDPKRPAAGLDHDATPGTPARNAAKAAVRQRRSSTNHHQGGGESPGRNERERIGGPESDGPGGRTRNRKGEGSTGDSMPAGADARSGGVEATAR